MRNTVRLLLMGSALAAPMLAPRVATAGVSVLLSVNVAPPALPVYSQPICPGPGYLWTPGYWAYGPRGYYWIAGTWVRPPQAGLLWTPAWWGMDGGHYRFHPGYWGPHVGYYGGIRYGFGYPGSGFEGGEWRGREFFYNGAVSHVDMVHMRNVYRREEHFEGRDGDRREHFEADRRGPVYEDRGRPHEDFREHHDNGNHNGWGGREVAEHHDNGNRNGWDHGDHGNGHGRGDR